MKKVLLFSILLLTVGKNSYAGDAGWNSTTCYSASKRTVLTILDRYFEPEITIYTLVIDGAVSVYNTNDANIVVERRANRRQTRSVKVKKDGEDVFSLNQEELTVYQDPRNGTVAQLRNDKTPFVVNLQCKVYWPNP